MYEYKAEHYADAQYLPCWSQIDRIRRWQGVIAVAYALAFTVLIVQIIQWCFDELVFNGPYIAFFGCLWITGIAIIVYCDQALQELRLRR
jgi:hypothetical protein